MIAHNPTTTRVHKDWVRVIGDHICFSFVKMECTTDSRQKCHKEPTYCLVFCGKRNLVSMVSNQNKLNFALLKLSIRPTIEIHQVFSDHQGHKPSLARNRSVRSITEVESSIAPQLTTSGDFPLWGAFGNQNYSCPIGLFKSAAIFIQHFANTSKATASTAF